MRSRALVASLLLLAPRVARAQSPIEIVGRAGATRVPDDAGVEAASGPRECPTESWTFEVTLPNATISAPTVWAAAAVSCAPGERMQPNATCRELCGASRNVCTGSLAAGTNRYRFSIPTRWLVDPANGQCVAASGRRAVFLVIDGEVVALTPRRVRYDLLPPAPPREVDLTNFEDRVEVRWSYGTTGTAATDAGTASTDVVDAGSDVVDAAVVDAGPSTSTSNGGEETLSRFYVLCDPPTTQNPVAMDGGTCGTGALSALDLTRDDLLMQHRCADDTGPTARATNLARVRLGASYQVAVVAEDLAGNRSRVALAARCGSANPVTDFWETYRGAGGAAEPGMCAARPAGARSAGWGALPLLGVALAAWRRRRR
ncbi:MAG: hypothetical protein U0325_09640 [Polyangiales bacterium]